ncbi:MAG: (2Fe-2S)-binding protein, partial [Candidatus Tectomicrobia bacterium]|nr:(2Fe-2S)-binding protein [Candidatus Tectomicrobia bacterium]
HVGCEHGVCGCCTVLIDNHPTLACLTLAHSAAGHMITTIEGVAQGGVLHPLQEAFLEVGAVQCGYCTPGMILTAKALLDEEPEPSEEQIRQALAGNLCRCTGYQAIIDAVKLASKRLLAGQDTGLETSPPPRWHDLSSRPPER